MSFPTIFVVFFVSHQVGDYLLQTDWQASNKHGGLGPDPVARRALRTHIATYTLAFVPALIWLASGLEVDAVAAVAALIAIPHLVQDDGRLVAAYMGRVKGTAYELNRAVAARVDQALHLLALFGVALLASAMAG